MSNTTILLYCILGGFMLFTVISEIVRRELNRWEEEQRNAPYIRTRKDLPSMSIWRFLLVFVPMGLWLGFLMMLTLVFTAGAWISAGILAAEIVSGGGH